MEAPIQQRPGLSRRHVIAFGAGAAAAAVAPGAPAQANAPILARPIPHSGEMLPVVGVGTARVFNVGDDAEKGAEVRKVIEALVAGGGKLIDTASTYGSSEGVVGALVDAAHVLVAVLLDE